MHEDQKIVEQNAKQERELCISCLGENVPDTNFCRHCGTPMSAYAATGPFEHLLAFGDFVRKAARRGRWGTLVRVLIVLYLATLILAVVLGFMRA